MASTAGSWLVKIFTFFAVMIGVVSGIIQIVEYLKPPAAPTAPIPGLTATTASLPANPPAPASTSIASPNPPSCTTKGQTWTSPTDGMTLMCVPAGKFMMGAAASDKDARSDERPQHEVSLSAFWIDQTEVTNRQFELFVKSINFRTDAEKLGSGLIWTGSTWVDMKGAFWKQPKGPGSDLNGKMGHPVVQVSWNDADTYCHWAGRNLPSEAQWEMAARGTDGRAYPWGNATPDANRANFNYNVKDTTEVGKYSNGASPYGELDMAGNVWEWVADWYTDYSSTSVSNPPGPASGTSKALRGGSWGGTASDLRVTIRNPNYPTNRYSSVGFRCAAPPP